ncbi:extracellular solute-binding protein [Anaeromicropila herbilytica]|uniref:Maltodextrin-binding protein n=1 Tax=Anaeromicropila herbilytica TaxID=2785025 RepID=A0A7R7IDV0_9FIRM|nr:extracellular solute-binding protein [Anaeromicropila herbilytica]BCN31341.1 hypothetical protein bsdtb5_26360 [Anaeromicropila herbilytica]
MKKRVKQSISLLLCVLLVLGALTGCGSKDTKDTSKETKETTKEEAKESSTPKEPVSIKVWHDGNEAIMKTIETRVNDTLKDENITVTFEKKAGITDQMKLYGNDEANGPDMYMAAHDSLGTFAEMGILAPITDIIDTSVMADQLPMTVDAGKYKDTQYMLPIYFETLLFMYNKDLWQGEVPTTTDALYDYMVANTNADAGTYAVVNQHSTAYNVAPVINGFGGYIIDKDAKPGLNEQATKDAITYNQKFAKLEADGDYNTVTTLFNEGKAAAIIGGPWLIDGINKAGIKLGVKSLSSFTLPNGNALAPYSGVQGVGVMKYAAASKKDAIAKVLTVLAGPEVGIDLAKTANCAPANQKSYDDTTVAANEMIVAIKDTASTALPMPNIPQMSVMWGPTESLLAAVNKSGEDVNKAADKYQKEALKAISDMQ